MAFEFNYDLNNIKWKSCHNWFHVFASIVFVFLFYYTYDNKDIILSAIHGWSIGILWEIGDGFKPWHFEFIHDYSRPKWLNQLKENLLYSDKFSWQDVLVWDLGGVFLACGTLIILQ